MTQCVYIFVKAYCLSNAEAHEVWSFSNNNEEGKGEESIQPRTTPFQEHHVGK